MASYLAWAAFDALRIIHSSRCLSGPRTRLALTVAALLFLAVIATEARWADFRNKVAYHETEEWLHRLSAEGQRGVIIACGERGCRSYQIPVANNAADRSRMLRAVEHHARLKLTYKARW